MMVRFTHQQIPKNVELYPTTPNLPLFLNDHNITTARSSNILTWMQSITDEIRETFFLIMMAIHEQQKILQAASTTTITGCTLLYYQVHAAKLIYFLT